ncbi:MAG: alanine--tRNA ligase, partial [Fidelibacterota bacterium]
NQSSDGVNNLDDYREIWNLVFIQYNRDETGKLTDLPEKHVDTGAGFERLAAVLNQKTSNYETDIFTPLINEISLITGTDYSDCDGVAHQVIADHVRMLSFAIADGALPGNEGRGYVLRRVLRRAARFGRSLGMHEPFIYKLVSKLGKEMQGAFPEILEKRVHIEKTLKSEETSFSDTLDKGLDIFSKLTKNMSAGDIIPGEDAFKLYDTFGFPLDLTQLLAREKQMTVDEAGFQEKMDQQKERARSAGNFTQALIEKDWEIVTKGMSSEFIGYTHFENPVIIRKFRRNNKKIELILDKTPFYAEQGGQIGDTGFIQNDELIIQITDTKKDGDEIAHFGTIISGSIENNVNMIAKIDIDRRNHIRRNHTATHLLHKALKITLGEHVQQAGSMVAPDKLRFDLTHFESLSNDQINEIENLVNKNIRKNNKVELKITTYDQAKKDGAVALFGEKYGSEVRMVTVPGFSCELCGGTHVDRTGDIGVFKIISESALATGVRRIEAITGEAVIEFMHHQNEIIRECSQLLKTSSTDLLDKLNSLLVQKRHLEKQIEVLQTGSQKEIVKKLVNKSEVNNGIRVIIESIKNAGDLKQLGDEFRSSLKQNGVVLIFTVRNERPMVMCAVTDDLTSKIQAGNIVSEMGKFLGGGGGGKPHLATSGGRDQTKVKDAMALGKKVILSIISDK